MSENETRQQDIAMEDRIRAAEQVLFAPAGSDITPEEITQALADLEEAAEAGDAAALLDLGSVWYNGEVVTQDFAKAVSYYRCAADKGNVTAINNMGYMYYYGRSMPVDMEQAYRFFSKAALLCDENATFKCGDMYRYGYYVTKDENTAFELYQQSYDMLEKQRNIMVFPDAAYRLGTCFHKGIGTSVNLLRAERYLSEAVQGFSDRLENGDRFTQNVYEQANAEWQEVQQMLDAVSPWWRMRK